MLNANILLNTLARLRAGHGHTVSCLLLAHGNSHVNIRKKGLIVWLAYLLGVDRALFVTDSPVIMIERTSKGSPQPPQQQ